MPTTTVNGVRLFYEIAGQGVPLVLVHGSWDSHLDWIRTLSRPVLLSRGVQSPPLFAPVVTRLAEAIPHAEVVTFPDAGHIPHTTQPDAYVDAILAFTARHAR